MREGPSSRRKRWHRKKETMLSQTRIKRQRPRQRQRQSPRQSQKKERRLLFSPD